MGKRDDQPRVIGVDESPNLRVIVPALEEVVPGVGIVAIAPVAQGIDLRHGTGRGKYLSCWNKVALSRMVMRRKAPCSCHSLLLPVSAPGGGRKRPPTRHRYSLPQLCRRCQGFR